MTQLGKSYQTHVPLSTTLSNKKLSYNFFALAGGQASVATGAALPRAQTIPTYSVIGISKFEILPFASLLLYTLLYTIIITLYYSQTNLSLICETTSSSRD